MSSTNSAIPLRGATLQDIEDSLGVPQFGTEGQWDFIFNGLVYQGGKVSLTSPSIAVAFHAQIGKQVLGVFTQVISVAGHTCTIQNVTLTGFEIHAQNNHDVFWWAIGA